MLALLLALLTIAPDTLAVQLERLDVTATRAQETAATAPAAVAVLVRDPVERTIDSGASLESALRGLPGLWVADRENVALGERLAVRGMGARAGFGVRGVQVVLDGVPLTLPDGQAGLLIADPSLIRRAELLRGPASTFWGNGSGGALLLETLPEAGEGTSFRTLGGSYGLWRIEGESTAPLGRHQVGLALSHVRRDGYRAHSAFAVTRARGFGRIDLGGGARLVATGALELAPLQEHPGSLTLDEFRADPRQAQPNFVAQQAGKDSRQGQVGLALTAPTRLGTVRATAFGVARSMVNPLPFAVIDLGRLAGGTRLAVDRTDGPLDWGVGLEAGIQQDDRQNHANQAGERGALRLDQLETVTALAAFSRAAYRTGPVTLSAGLRHDRTRFEADDRMDGEVLGERTLAAWSPSLGASLRLGPALAFASFSTAFETPTTTELVNRPDGGAGFNPDLRPQTTRGFDLGVRGTDRAGRLYYDAAVFLLNVDDQLVPFEGADGRTYYRNAEAARHTGVEALVEARVLPALRLGATYGWSRFVLTRGALDGNRLPGVPEHRLSAFAQGTLRDAVARVELRSASAVWADDANTARSDGFAVVDVRLAHAGLPLGDSVVLPFAEVRNVFDAAYVGSVNLNAAGGRFLEPGAARSFALGVRVTL